MSKPKYRIRLATENDAQAVHDIYGAYVLLDYVTFTEAALRAVNELTKSLRVCITNLKGLF